MDAVSEVLIARADKSDGMNTMLSVSVIVHLALLGVFVFVPASWFGAEEKRPETIMQVSLGGPVGPDAGGLTTLGGRTIQDVAVETKRAIEPVRPPAAKPPEMIEPTKAPPRKATPPKVDAKDPKGAKPTKGKEIEKGSSIAETGARGQGFGLSAGGGGTGGVQLEVSNFCCPEYLATMVALIKANWNNQQGAAGSTQMRFVIQKDGRIVEITVQRSSGVQALDFFAERALRLTKLPPLPQGYKEQALAVRLFFDYSR
ncbi:MAG TPA: TonB C-terminal domain-containing protein [Vicinamibacterales bacterium]|nr:TonB C-terminal domain-containing protein [Vicinamibacterales bacterium]